MRIPATAARLVLAAVIAGSFLVHPPAPRPLTPEEIAHLEGFVDPSIVATQGRRLFVLHGETSGVSWDVYVRFTPIGRCLIVATASDRGEACAFRAGASDKPVVAFRFRLPNLAHLVVGIAPRRSVSARIAFEGGPTINAEIVLLGGTDAGYFLARVPATAGAAAVEAFDSQGESLGRWPLPAAPASELR